MPSVSSRRHLLTMRNIRPVLAGLLLALGVLVLAPGPAQATTHRVTIQQYAYGPSSLSVKQGDTVTWTNLDTVEHDVVVTSGPASFRSPMLGKGQSWSYTFTTPGTYSYICSVHPDMKASVTAAAAPAPATSAAAPPTSTTPSPSAAETHADDAHHAEKSADAKPAEGKKNKGKGKSSAQSGTDAAQAATVMPATVEPSLNPLLLVLGASIAVVVFCLLLMASRPVPAVAAADPPPDDEDD